MILRLYISFKNTLYFIILSIVRVRSHDLFTVSVIYLRQIAIVSCEYIKCIAVAEYDSTK